MGHSDSAIGESPRAAQWRIERLTRTLRSLSPNERQLLTCALAGNHPESLAWLRRPMIEALMEADR